MADRLQQVVERLLHSVHEAICELQITEPELTAAVHYLNDVGRTGQFQILADVMKVSVLVNDITYASDVGTTAVSVEGPFYRRGAPRFANPARICRRDEPGERLRVRGHVIDAVSRAPLAGAELDIWQGALNGKYDHEDPQQPEWNLRGVLRTEVDGSYEFETVLPQPYPVPEGTVSDLLRRLGRHNKRPGHIHFKLRCEGYQSLTTMLFFEGDPYLADDVIGAVREELIMHPRRVDGGGAAGDGAPSHHLDWDFALQRAQA